MFWKSTHKEDNAFLFDDSDLWYHQLFQESLLSTSDDESLDVLNQKVSTMSFAASHLVINCSGFPAMISWFLEVVDKTEAISHQESDLLGSKETHSCAWESKELQTWDSRQNSRYAEYGELYEACSKLVK